MSHPGTFASLSPCLLARKGGAKPAMKSQLHALHQTYADVATPLPDDWSNDLGWNDYQGWTHESDSSEAEAVAEVVAIGTAKALSPVSVPEVIRQRGRIATRLSTASRRSDGKADEKKRRSALEEGRRCAFTLRLDAERHLRLRLAGAVHNRSAQAIVTDALDHYLAEMPEIETLAEQARARSRKS